MLDIHDTEIQLIEDRILLTYNDKRMIYPDCDCLLDWRKSLINKKALAHQVDILPDIIAFNDALRGVLKEMYDRALRIWETIKDNKTFGDEITLTAKCFLGYKYPELHPLQGKDRQELWDAICDPDWNRMYDKGASMMLLSLPMLKQYNFDFFIGQADSPPLNWNFGLDQELTKDLHLTSAFHHLFEHTKFAITDFIYVRKFETEINIEIDKQV